MKLTATLYLAPLLLIGCGVTGGGGDLMKQQQKMIEQQMKGQEAMMAKSQLMQEMMANPDLPAWHEQREKMALALGEGAEAAAPLGRAVIGGLAAATLATLIVLPSVYSLIQQSASSTSPSLDPDDPESAFRTQLG